MLIMFIDPVQRRVRDVSVEPITPHVAMRHACIEYLCGVRANQRLHGTSTI